MRRVHAAGPARSIPRVALVTIAPLVGDFGAVRSACVSGVAANATPAAGVKTASNPAAATTRDNHREPGTPRHNTLATPSPTKAAATATTECPTTLASTAPPPIVVATSAISPTRAVPSSAGHGCGCVSPLVAVSVLRAAEPARVLAVLRPAVADLFLSPTDVWDWLAASGKLANDLGVPVGLVRLPVGCGLASLLEVGLRVWSRGVHGLPPVCVLGISTKRRREAAGRVCRGRAAQARTMWGSNQPAGPAQIAISSPGSADRNTPMLEFEVVARGRPLPARRPNALA